MDTIAIISDIHSNITALKAVLADIQERNIKHIYCLGDIIAKGSNAHECIQLVRDHCEVVLQGNCDAYFSLHHETYKNEKEKNRILWNQSKLSQDERNYLLSLPMIHELMMSGRLIRLMHASPNNNYEFIVPNFGYKSLYTLFEPSIYTSENRADIVIYGHTHMAYSLPLYNRLIINTGSVGNPIDIIREDSLDGSAMNTTQAHYLILTGYINETDNKTLSYEMVQVPYDINQELNMNQDNIELEAYILELKQGRYRDSIKTKKGSEKHG